MVLRLISKTQDSTLGFRKKFSAPTSNIDITPDIFAELSKIKNIKYCKESTMDVTRVKEIDNQSKGKIKVFGGIMGYESYLNGAIGWVSVPSNIVPQECTNIYESIKIKKIFKMVKKSNTKIPQ